ncbi:MAG TPA: hypothetical protein VM305_07085 [Candidatus Limnocylindrales bacterium]|nr:hypothetical protein [Candidatus Limnocylindrales bacterium]
MEATAQLLLALALAAVTGSIITFIGSGTIERAASAFSLLVGGWRPDPWPRGVQEEDRDRPWATGIRPVLRAASHARLRDGTAPVAASRVRSRTRPR